MITRKQAKQVMEQWERDKQQYGVVVVKEFIEQFPDVLTPDEMLAEMREWARERGILFRCFDNNHPNMVFCLINIGLPIESNKPMIEVDRKDRSGSDNGSVPPVQGGDNMITITCNLVQKDEIEIDLLSGYYIATIITKDRTFDEKVHII